MRSRFAVVVVVCSIGLAHADPTPQKVDIKPFRDELLVFNDAAGNVYVVKPYKAAVRKPQTRPYERERLWFGAAGKPLYEQLVVNRSRNGAAWTIGTWAPRIPNIRPAQFQFRKDGSYVKLCGDQPEVVLTQLTGDKAKAVLDKTPIMTESLVRRPHKLARDDRGVYYYVDKLGQAYGSKGFRVWVGKKGSMKQLPLTDVASDTAGEVFSTKTGDLRLDNYAAVNKVFWIRGEKKTELINLNVDANSDVIFSDLGIYQFLGTLCDNM